MKLRDPKKAITDATSLHMKTPGNESAAMYGCKIDKSTSSTADGLIVDAIEAGRILKAIDSQSLMVRKWLYYAYSAVPTNECKYLVIMLFDELFSNEKEKYRDRMKRLCFAAIEDYKVRVVNERKLPDEDIATLIGVSRPNLERDGHLTRIKRVQKRCAEFDEKGLAVVSGVLDELRGRRCG